MGRQRPAPWPGGRAQVGLTRGALVTFVLCAACSSESRSADPGQPLASNAVPMPAAPLAGTRRVLPGHVSARTKRGSDLGRMDPATRLEGMTVVFAPSGSRAQRDAMLAALQDPGSPLYHRWLTPESYAARFGASSADVERVTQWLESQGFEVAGASRPRTSLRFSGTVDRLERAFQTEMHRYQVGGESHFALAVEPSVPVELGEVVAGLRNVHDFHPTPTSHPAPAYKSGTSYQLAPADWARIYDVTPLYQEATPLDGAGQKIAIVGASAVEANDVLAFRAMFGLSATLPVTTLVPDTGPGTNGAQDYQQEASLDVEWAGAIAPSATVEYVFVGEDRNHSVDDAALYALDNAVAPIVSFSYASCEGDYPSIDAVDFSWEGDLAAMLGITFVAAAGDGAAADCDETGDLALRGLSVAMPASIPGALSVGGTTLLAEPRSRYFDSTGLAVSYIPELGWNETTVADAILGGTGGASSLFAKPFWQVGITPADGARDVPDLAFAAGDNIPYVVVAQGTTIGFGGTSCAAPSFAGVLAIINQAIGAAQPGLGNVGPVLYALAGSPVASSVFHDVTQGSNVVPCASGTPDCPASQPYQYGYDAGPGYDQVTGIGSVNAAALVQAWSALTPTGTMLGASQGGTTEQSVLTLTAAVSSTGSGTVAMTGDVIFYYETGVAQSGPLAVAPLGSVPVTPTTSHGAAAASAQLITHAPAGFTGTSTIVALYSGDASYLASWSTTATVTATSNLAISPDFSRVPLLGTVAFTSSGGVPPVTWSIWQDDSTGTIDSASGLYAAGGNGGGQDIVLARDAYGAQAMAIVDVARPDGGAPAPGSSSSDGDDAGKGVSAGPYVPEDAGDQQPPAAEVSMPVFTSFATGGGCTAAGRPAAPGSAVAALAFALVGWARGRRPLKDRGPCSSRTSWSARRRAPRRGR